MSEVSRDKEVYYDIYCKTCEHKDLSEDEDPCWDCLDSPTNTYSHKPIHWSGKDGYSNEHNKRNS